MENLAVRVDTRAIPSDLVDDFRAAGLSHLLAVSGANVAFALAIAEPVLRRRRLGTRFAGGIVVLAVFGTMTRWEPSVLRAAAMAGLVMLARWLGRCGPGPRLRHDRAARRGPVPAPLGGFPALVRRVRGHRGRRRADRATAAGTRVAPRGARRDHRGAT